MQFRKLPQLMAGVLGVIATLIAASATQAAPSNSQPSPVVYPAQHDATDLNAASIPPERIKASLDAYSQWLDVVAQRDEVAGMATAVVVGNKVVLEREIGYADASTQEPITADTVFRLASLSKAFATAVTGLLVNDGRFSWDTKLTDVLPFFQLKDAQASSAATVKEPPRLTVAPLAVIEPSLTQLTPPSVSVWPLEMVIAALLMMVPRSS